MRRSPKERRPGCFLVPCGKGVRRWSVMALFFIGGPAVSLNLGREDSGMAKKTLLGHRTALAEAGNNAYTHELTHDIDRLRKTLTAHLKEAGYRSRSTEQTRKAIKRMVQLLFEAQEERPIFHVEGTQLPLCWNLVKDWDKDYIKYEWGHLLSINQNSEAAFDAENLALYSARCNSQIQTSMDIQELMIYGGILAQRITLVLTNRRKLFESERWKQCIAELGPRELSRTSRCRRGRQE